MRGASALIEGVQEGSLARAEGEVEEEESLEKSIFTLAFLNLNPWSPERKMNVKRRRVAGWEWNVPWQTVETEPRTPASERKPMSFWVMIVERGEGSS